MLWSQPPAHAVLSCVVSWISPCLPFTLHTLSPGLWLCLLNIKASSLFGDTAVLLGDRSRSHLMAAWFLQAVTFELSVPGGLYEIALWPQQLGTARRYVLRKSTAHPCLSAALGGERQQSPILPSLLSLGVLLLLAGVLGKFTEAMGWLGSGSSRLDLELQFWILFSQWFFSLPWLPLPPRALCLLLLWKLSLQLSMALWKEVLHLRELTCPQDFCSRWVCGCAALSSWWEVFFLPCKTFTAFPQRGHGLGHIERQNGNWRRHKLSSPAVQFYAVPDVSKDYIRASASKGRLVLCSKTCSLYCSGFYLGAVVMLVTGSE